VRCINDDGNMGVVGYKYRAAYHVRQKYKRK
jgi:hypothetical protein